MNVLIPGTSHQITWSIQNLTDLTTYYVQAKIRDTRTDTLLATVNLTNLGSSRFSGSWNVPQDPSGFGRNIEIEKTVYTDAGYTTASETYGRWLDQYLIFNLGARNSSTGGYGGASVDYKKIAELIKTEVEALKKELTDQESNEKPEKVDLSEVLSALHGITSGLSGLSTRISAVEDAGGVSHEKIDGASESIDGLRESVSRAMNVSTESVIRLVEQVREEVLSQIQQVSKADMVSIGRKLDAELSTIVQSFSDVMDGQGKKISGHIEDTLKKPINVSLVGKTVPPEATDPRKEKITNMLT